MTPERWREIQDLFHDALDRPAAVRAAFLDAACAGDAALRAQVDALLLADAAPPALLYTTPSGAGHPVEDDAFVGQRIGPYQILKPIGRGGMGAVYLAQRADEAFHQQVALKVVRSGMDTEVVRQRFRNERQILAALNHPHIARLLDGGTTGQADTAPHGLAYFVMEYIDGIPLTDYCDQYRLTVDERLRLFQDVCRAVHYAHQNLVVHRDLKPGNILVAADGQVKLLDFGIAKLLNPTLGLHDFVRTEQAQRLMTPAYASPEQVRGEQISTASDVYSLGVLLYELLSGHRPYRLPSQIQAELHRIICEEDPEAPSTAVAREDTLTRADGSTDVVTPTAVGQSRQLSPEQLRNRLSGDLDTIILKAMRKEPQRRYTSAEAFAEDVYRHLVGLPVTARKSSTGYRVRKFVSRHKTGVLATALVGLSLIAGLGGALWQAQAKAREAAKAEEVKTFMLNLFTQADPDQAKGEELTAKELVAQGTKRVREELTGQPEVQSEMLSVLAHVHYKLGNYDEALSLLEEALPLVNTHYGPAHEKTAEVHNDLALAQMKRGTYPEAEAHLNEALARYRARYGDESNQVAQTLNNLGTLYGTHYGKHDISATHYRKSVAIRRKILHADHPDLLHVLHNLALTLEREGKYAESETLYREVLEKQRRVLGPAHTEFFRTMNNLAVTLNRQSKYNEAIALQRETIALKTRHFGEAHPEVATSIYTLGALLNNRRQEGDFEESEAMYQRALDLRRQIYGNEHDAVGTTLQGLSTILMNQKQYPKAEAYAREALAIHRKTLGDTHWRIVVDHFSVAKPLFHLKRYPEAAQVLGQTYDLALQTWRKDHPILGDILVYQARVLMAQNQPAAAEAKLRESVRINVAQLGDQNGLTGQAKMWLGICLTQLHRYPEAKTVLQESLTTLEAAEGVDAEQLLQVRTALAQVNSQN